MNKSIQLIIAAIMLFTNYSYAQNPIWSLAPDYIKDEATFSLPQPTPPNGLSQAEQDFYYYHGQAATAASNAQADAQGNLLFFIVDDKVYDKDGYLIDQVYNTDYQVKGNTEIMIIPEPGSCERFYIFLYSNGSDQVAFYAIIDLSTANRYSENGSEPMPNLLFGERDGALTQFNDNQETAIILPNFYDSDDQHNYTGFLGSSRLVDVIENGITVEKRYIFASSFDGLYYYSLTSSGLSYIGLLTEFDDAHNNVYDGTGELEVALAVDPVTNSCTLRVAYPFHNEELHQISVRVTDFELGTESFGNSISIDFPNFGTDKVYPHGLEFSPDGNLLYISHSLNGNNPNPLEVYNFTTSSLSALNLPLANDYKLGQIEMGFNNRMYFAKESGMAFITNPNVIPTNWAGSINVNMELAHSGITNYSNLSPDHYFSYILPDQRDADYDYSASFFVTCECCAKNVATDVESYTVSNTEIWNGTSNPINPNSTVIYIRDELRIPAGSKLYIYNMTVKFGPNAKVIVEARDGSLQRGKLYMSHATFTSNENSCSNVGSASYSCENNPTTELSIAYCDRMWQGVVVLGHSNQPQSFSNYSHQGLFIMRNNSLIENAKIGVQVGTTNSSNSGNTGGIVRTKNSTFKNNGTDVVIYPYFNTNSGGTVLSNYCKFDETTFVVDDHLYNNYSGLFRRMFLYRVKGVKIRACDFKVEGQALNAYPPNLRGTGIISWNASFQVYGACSVCDPTDITAHDIGTSQSSINPCTFSNFAQGIYASGLGYGNASSVKYSLFDNNMRGAYFIKIKGAEFFKNKFLIPSGDNQEDYYGVELLKCTAYSVERNFFKGLNLNYKNTGIWIVSSGSSANEIYLNDFESLFMGSAIQGNNRNTNPFLGNIGLQLLCGKYDYNKYDITLNGPGVKMSSWQGSSSSPAGNIFDSDFSGNESHLYLDQSLPNVAGFIYWHHQEINYNVKPDYYSNNGNWYTNFTLFNGNNIPFVSRFESCPTEDSYAIMNSSELVQEKRDIIDEMESNLDQLIDNGNTDLFLSTVNSPAYSSSEVRSLLIPASPYISDEVLVASINRIDPLNQWHLCEILLANSPLSSTVWNAYEEKAPLADYLHNLLFQYQNGTSLQTNFVSQIREEQKIKDRALRGFIGKVFSDTLEVNVNEIKDIIEGEELNMELQTKIELAIMQQNIPEAQELLIEYNDDASSHWKEVMEIYTSLDYSFSNATEDQISTLHTIADSHENGSIEAMVMLEIITGEPIDVELIYPNENKSANANSSVKPVSKRKPELAGVYPNPAKGEFYITYVLPTEKDNASIDIYNLEGKLVRSEDITNGYGILQLDSRQFEAGLYLFNLQLNGETVATHKFTVVE